MKKRSEGIFHTVQLLLRLQKNNEIYSCCRHHTPLAEWLTEQNIAQVVKSGPPLTLMYVLPKETELFLHNKGMETMRSQKISEVRR